MTLRLLPMQLLLLVAGGCGMGVVVAGPLSQDATGAADASLTVPMIPDDAVAGQRLGSGFSHADPAGANAPAVSRGIGAALSATNMSVDSDDADHVDIGPVSSRHRQSLVPVEENPRVELLDVMKSVTVGAVRSVPWLRLRSPVRHPRSAHAGAPGDPSADGPDKVQFEPYVPKEQSDGSVGGGSGGGGSDYADSAPGTRRTRGERVNLVREAVQLVRDIAGNPLTWVVLILFGIVSLMLSLARGRENK